MLEDCHSLSGQSHQHHSCNDTGLDTKHEIKPMLSQHHIDPPILLFSHPLHSQLLFTPQAISNSLATSYRPKPHVSQWLLRETEESRHPQETQSRKELKSHNLSRWSFSSEISKYKTPSNSFYAALGINGIIYPPVAPHTQNHRTLLKQFIAYISVIDAHHLQMERTVTLIASPGQVYVTSKSISSSRTLNKSFPLQL